MVETCEGQGLNVDDDDVWILDIEIGYLLCVFKCRRQLGWFLLGLWTIQHGNVMGGSSFFVTYEASSLFNDSQTGSDVILKIYEIRSS